MPSDRQPDDHSAKLSLVDAAAALGMSAKHLTRLQGENRVAGAIVDGQVVVSTDEIRRIRVEQERSRAAARRAVASAGARRRQRAASRLNVNVAHLDATDPG